MNKRLPKPQTEAQHQAAVVQWAQQPAVRNKWPQLKLLYHVPNGGSRDRVEGAHLKRQGVKKGVPDLCLPVPRGRYHGLYIELKTEKGKTGPEQEWWLRELNEQGYSAFVCRGWEAAVRTLEWYLELEAQI